MAVDEKNFRQGCSVLKWVCKTQESCRNNFKKICKLLKAECLQVKIIPENKKNHISCGEFLLVDGILAKTVYIHDLSWIFQI